jgi:hypothetical protein
LLFIFIIHSHPIAILIRVINIREYIYHIYILLIVSNHITLKLDRIIGSIKFP